MPDELDDYEEGVEQAEADEEELEHERVLADAEELADGDAEGDVTPFDEARLAYSGVDDGGGGVDLEELEDAGARLDDPEHEAGSMDS